MISKYLRYTLLAAVMLLTWACNNVNEPKVDAMDAEVRLDVRINASKAGDPGTDHGEWNPQWKTLVVYFVYDNNNVVEYPITREEYDKDSLKGRKFTVFEGTATVYAVAYGSAQKYSGSTTGSTVGEVKNLRTIDVEALGATEYNEYMLSLFSGKTGKPVTLTKDNPNQKVDVTLNRLISKVDVQYDAQGAYEGGKYTDVKMSQITFTGLSKGYFFPGEATIGDGEANMEKSYDATMSERNGRTSFYTFPGVKDKISFTVTYQSTGSLNGDITYNSVFKEKLEQAAWYKVNFTIKGNNAGSNNIDIELSHGGTVQP